MRSRLKYFCQLCRKQCKDENGLHCHKNSAHHQKKVMEFMADPTQHISRASSELQFRFLQILKDRYKAQAVKLQDLYDSYRKERRVIEFSETKWENLKEFSEHLATLRNILMEGEWPNVTVKYTVTAKIPQLRRNQLIQLQKQGITDSQISAPNRLERRKLASLEDTRARDEEAYNKARLKLRQEREQDQVEQHYEDQPLAFTIDGLDEPAKRSALFTANELEEETKKGEIPKKGEKKLAPHQILAKKLQEKLDKVEKAVKAQEPEEEEWVTPGIIVQVLPHEIPVAFHQKKGKVIAIVEPYVARVAIGQAFLEVDQTYLQTVVPKLGGQVKILKGKYKNKIGTLIDLNIEQGYGHIEIPNQPKISQIGFSSFSKYEASGN